MTKTKQAIIIGPRAFMEAADRCFEAEGSPEKSNRIIQEHFRRTHTLPNRAEAIELLRELDSQQKK